MKNRKRLIIKFIAILVLSVLIIVMVGPFAWMISTSLKKSSDVFTEVPTLLPRDKKTGEIYINFKNYLNVFKYSGIGKAFLNTIIVTFSATALNLLINSMAAFSFACTKWPARKKIFALLLSTMMVPFYTILIPMLFITKSLHLYNSLLGLIIPMGGSVYNLFLMKQFFGNIPVDLFEAAKIDGIGWFGLYRKIALPLSKPVLTVVGVTTFIWHWNSYTWPLVVINDPINYTLQLQLSLLVSSSGSRYSLMMAAATVAVFPILIVFIIFQKYLIKGITLTGLKE